jgi:hypothetical protein
MALHGPVELVRLPYPIGARHPEVSGKAGIVEQLQQSLSDAGGIASWHEEALDPLPNDLGVAPDVSDHYW